MKPSPPAAGHRYQKRGFSLDKGIRFFFASNAGLTIFILILIIAFLLKEGLGFFPGYQRELQVYRVAGLEYVDLSRANLTTHEQLTSLVNRAYYAEINAKALKELRRSEEANAVFNAFSETTDPTRNLIVNNLDAGLSPDSEVLAVMQGNYEAAREKALRKLPPTPHLTSGERQSLIDSLKNRDLRDSDPPALASRLTEEYLAARQKHAAPLQSFRDQIDTFEAAGMDLDAIVSDMTGTARSAKQALDSAFELEKERTALLTAAKRAKTAGERAKFEEEARAIPVEKPDTTAAIQQLFAKRDECIRIHTALHDQLKQIHFQADLHDGDARRLFNAARNALPHYFDDLTKAPEKLTSWDPDQKVPLSASIRSFLTGKNWITGGEWQDFYGILPLFVGSLMISLVALAIAIPAGIGAAIYTNQFASKREQAIIKPVIEFIQAIPSVVLGFIGILVFGTVLRDLSMADSLSWVPGFPIEERLNIFTAGCLLALMSIPTIFSLAEDALNNVPSVYSEASEALGASHIRTVFSVMVPAAFSGILAAVLLGLGRVIGETMVVLLVAGNRIKIPDFTAGLGAFFQPAHTLTGIIAQELGEVPMGSVHYRALFVVGILLFCIVLAINATAHKFVNRQQH
ncbi:MAG: phosphate ABC transporter permease subunit PstC [Luteolibacter sp.]